MVIWPLIYRRLVTLPSPETSQASQTHFQGIWSSPMQQCVTLNWFWMADGWWNRSHLDFLKKLSMFPLHFFFASLSSLARVSLQISVPQCCFSRFPSPDGPQFIWVRQSGHTAHPSASSTPGGASVFYIVSAGELFIKWYMAHLYRKVHVCR